ncbi:MAG: DUF2232 domain-containing protein [Thermoleophilia bacterium]|nr:DUF2232 domain-containing protein [Thermoleophilia bacterium]
MSTESRSALLQDGGKAVAFSVGLGVVIAFVPLFSIVAVPAMPIPAAFITSRYGVYAGLIVSLLTGAACMALTAPVVGFAAGLLIFLLTAIAGLGGGLALRKGVTQFRLFVSMVVVFFAALFVWLAALLLLSGQGPVSAIESLADATAEPSRQIYQSVGMNEQDVDEAIAQAREFALLLPYLAPAVLLVVSIALSGANLAIGRRVFERLRQPFPRDFVFRDLRIHWVFAYAIIIGLLCEFLAPYAPERYVSALELTGANLFIIAEVLFFIQGMAIANFFLWVYKVARVKRLAVYFCLVLLQLTLSLTSWIGLFDTWLDYRRRFIRKNLSGQ